MHWRQMIGVGVRNVVLARGELDKLEGPITLRGERSYADRDASERKKELYEYKPLSQQTGTD